MTTAFVGVWGHNCEGAFFESPSTAVTFFDADGYYLAVFVDRRDPKTTLLWHPRVFVFKKQLQLVASIAPR